MRERWARIAFVVLVAAMGFINGCAGIGPATVARDRFDYSTAISESWKNQMLLNIVKMRYGDTPTFLDVASVINQYELQARANVDASWQSPLISNSNTLGIGGGVVYIDRPTITYSPLTGEKFARNLMTPISASAVFHLVQSGYPIDMVLRFAVQSINGIQNRFGGPARTHSADPEFYPLLEKLKKTQNSNSIGMRVERMTSRDTVVVVFGGKADPAIQEESREIRKVLGLDPGGTEFSVVYDSVSRNSKEIAIITRSMLEILLDLASLVEVPESHVKEKRVNPTFREEVGGGVTIAPLMRIYSSDSIERPAEAFATIYYRGHWFFIDDRDMSSKALFSFLMVAFSLTETGAAKDNVPIVTIPTR